MKLNRIQSEEEYLRVMNEIQRLMDAKPDTPDGERLNSLAMLAEEWEEKHYPIDPPAQDPS
jgi:HTH-type transcriptional regulator/antitoxin HigA